MKKLFSFFFALMCTVALNAAEFYMVGDATPAGWDLGKACDTQQMTEVSTDVFEWTGVLSKDAGEGFKILAARDWNPGLHPSEAGLLINEVGSDEVALPYSGDPDTKWKVSETAEYTIRVTLGAESATVVCEKVGEVSIGVPEVDGVYQISTADEAVAFATAVNNGTIANNCSVVLTQNLDLASVATWTPIGTDGKKWQGTFDGQGYRVLNMTLDGNAKEQGLFGVAGPGALIKNLIIDASCTIVSTGGAVTSAFVGCVNNDGTITFENCGNEADVTGTQQNNSAFVGCNYGGGCKLVFKNCYNTGNISGGWENGVFSGWSGGGATIINCINYGTITEAQGEHELARGNVTITNCYDVNGLQGASTFTEEELASGALCYALNNGGDNWYQTLDVDAKPVPFATSSKVYANGTFDCAGNSKGGDPVYSNTEERIQDEHAFADGNCSVCGAFDEKHLLVDGWYEIANAQDLAWFSELVFQYKGNKSVANEDANAPLNAKLTADIDMTDVQLRPIGALWGQNGTRYSGTFDGQGHKISNLDMELDQDNVGIFGVVAEGAVIKNFVVDASCSIQGNSHVGIIGEAWKSHNGEVHIDRVGNEAFILGSGSNVGGILGVNMNNGGYVKLYMTNCYNTGHVEGANENGVLTGWSGDGAVLENCLAAGECVNCDPVGRLGGGSTHNNIYTNVEVNWGPTYVTAEQLASGEVAFKLGEAFGQTIGTDVTPVLGGKAVYAYKDSYTNLVPAGDVILASNQWNGVEYTAKAVSFDSGVEFGGWGTNNPNYNVIQGTPENDANDNAWYAAEFDDAAWGEMTAPINNFVPNFGEVYVRREFVLDSQLPTALYLTAGHDDAPCEYYLNGELVWSRTGFEPYDGWKNDEVVKLTDDQIALLKEGEKNVLAFHVHQNWGGMYADAGLYTAGNMVNDYENDHAELNRIIAGIEAVGTTDEALLAELETAKAWNYRQGVNDETKRLLVARNLAAAAKVNPAEIEGVEPAEGDYYILNVGTGLFLNTTADWATHISIDNPGMLVHFAQDGEWGGAPGRPVFHLSGNGWNGMNWSEEYWDKNGENKLAFVPVEGQDKTYYLCEWDAYNWYFTYNPLDLACDGGRQYWNAVQKYDKNPDSYKNDPYAMWKIVTKDQLVAYMQTATPSEPKDATVLIENAGFIKNNGENWTYGWENPGEVVHPNEHKCGVMEWFERDANLKQTLTGIPAGMYEVSVNGFFRDGSSDNEASKGGQNLKQLASLVAINGADVKSEALLPNVTSEAGHLPGIGQSRPGVEGEFAIMPIDAHHYFQAGLYKATTTAIVGADGNLTIGIEMQNDGTEGNWVVVDNFRLTYLGPVELGTPEFNVDNDPFYGLIEIGDLEANGLKLQFPEAKGITPDMQIKVNATLQTSLPTMGVPGEEEGLPEAGPVELVDCTDAIDFYGDAMFGTPEVFFTDFAQYIVEAGNGAAYGINVNSIELLQGENVISSWTANAEEGDIVGTVFEVTVPTPIFEGEPVVTLNSTELVLDEKTEVEYAQYYTFGITFPEMVGTAIETMEMPAAVVSFEIMSKGMELTSGEVLYDIKNATLVEPIIQALQAGAEYTFNITKVAVMDYAQVENPEYIIPYETTDGYSYTIATLLPPMPEFTLAKDVIYGEDGDIRIRVTFEGLELSVNPSYNVAVTTNEVEAETEAVWPEDWSAPITQIDVILPEEVKNKERDMYIEVVFPAGSLTFEVAEGVYVDNTEEYYFTIAVATDIDAVKAQGKNVIYNLKGQKMNSTVKGVNIVNGQKVVVKK